MRAQIVSSFCEFCNEKMFALIHKNTFDHKNRIPVISAKHGDPRVRYFSEHMNNAATPSGRVGNLSYMGVMDKWHSIEFLKEL